MHAITIVQDVLIAAGAVRKEILVGYPYLESDDIPAALLYTTRQSDHPVLQAAYTKGGTRAVPPNAVTCFNRSEMPAAMPRGGTARVPPYPMQRISTVCLMQLDKYLYNFA